VLETEGKKHCIQMRVQQTSRVSRNYTVQKKKGGQNNEGGAIGGTEE